MSLPDNIKDVNRGSTFSHALKLFILVVVIIVLFLLTVFN